MFALLGKIRIGVSAHTGPTASNEALKNDYAEHAVLEGKPVLQKMGEALDLRNLSFFFDETFCDPGAENAKLMAAHITQSPMPLVIGLSIYQGKSFVVEATTIEHQKTTPSGIVTRLEGKLKLKEAPAGPPFLNAPGRGAAALINPFIQRT